MAKFVTIDGPSGVGKSTVSALIRQLGFERGVDVLLTTTPSGSVIGELARNGTHQYGGMCLTCLVAADRYDHAQRVIEPAMNEGRTVVCDRYVPSSLVFDRMDGVPVELVWRLYGAIRVPDVAFVLLGEPAVCAARAAKRGSYSRFHSVDATAASLEHELYRGAIDFLDQVGYPVQPYEIGEAAADDVARGLMCEIV